MARITYLFGAGASANALPTVKQMPIRIRALGDILTQEEFRLPDESFYSNKLSGQFSQSEWQFKFIEDLRWLADKSDSHASIDTFAKKLTVKGRPELLKLKVITTLFFALEQVIRPIDYRYDSFLTSLLDPYYQKMPNELMFLSWNYDYQLELANKELSGNNYLEENYKLLNSKTKSFPLRATSEFSTFKLNGICAHHKLGDSSPEFLFDVQPEKIDITVVWRVVELYTAFMNNSTNLVSALSFAWEEPKYQEVLMKSILERASHTEVLIVLGYSFPFFNRSIDRKIIRAMPLKKIYYQDKNPNVPRQRMKTIVDDNKIEHILYEEIEEFLVPYEL